MNEPVDHPVWSDERIESLLREFFRNEMPAELLPSPETRDQSPELEGCTPARLGSGRSTPDSRLFRGRLAGVATAATAVAAVWVALMLQAPVGEERSADGPEAKSRASVAEDSDSGAAPLDRLGRPGVRPPVELRSRGGVEHVAEPGLEIEYPEWEADIRIYRIEEQEKRKRK